MLCKLCTTIFAKLNSVVLQYLWQDFQFISSSLNDIDSHTQNIYANCNTFPPNDCLSVCRHHGICGCTSVRPILGTFYVVYPEYLLVLCQRSSNLFPCKLTRCRLWICWCHGTRDWQWLTFDHLLMPHWSQLRFIWLTENNFNTLCTSTHASFGGCLYMLTYIFVY